MEPDINGKWTGKLIYGSNFGLLEHEVLFFVLDIIQEMDEFSGTSRDVDGIGISPFETRLKGFLEAGNINFVKEYQVPVLASPYHSAPIHEAQPTEISFSGSYNPMTEEYEGDWILLSEYVMCGNVFYEKENGGTWSMKREQT